MLITNDGLINGTVRVISSEFSCKDANARITMVHLNLILGL